MSHHVAAAINSQNLTMIINIHRKGGCGTGKIKRGEESIVIEESVSVTIRKGFCHVVIEIEPNNLANVVDCIRSGAGSSREWYIDRQEQPSVPKEPMKLPPAIPIIANNLTVLVNPACFRESRTREITVYLPFLLRKNPWFLPRQNKIPQFPSGC
jgi:hypothetical protein